MSELEAELYMRDEAIEWRSQVESWQDNIDREKEKLVWDGRKWLKADGSSAF